MLDYMRKKNASIFTYIMLGGICFVFALNFGPGSGSCTPGENDYAAIVNNETISQRDFSVVYGRRIEQLRRTFQQTGGTLDPEMIARLGLKTQVIDGLIEGKLLAQEADRRGFRVSNDALLDYVNKNFGLENVSADQWEAFVNNVYQTTARRFEETVRKDLLGQKLRESITDNITISDQELKSSYTREFDRAMVNYVRFNMNTLAQPEPNPEEIAALMAETGDHLQKRYEKDINRYKTGKRVKVRQILKKLPGDADEKTRKEAEAKALELLKRLDKGEAFEAMAKTESDDERTSAKGGEMGTFTSGQMLKGLELQAFQLNAGEYSKTPIKTRLGYHIIKIDEILPEETKALETVKEKVAASILRERAAEKVAQEKADIFLAALRDGKSFNEMTVSEEERRQLPPMEAVSAIVRKTTPWILKEETSIPGIGTSQELQKAIFELSEEKSVADKAYRVGNSFYAIHFVNREIPSDEDFAGKKESLREEKLASKRRQIFTDWMGFLRKNATIQKNPALFGG